MEQTKIRKDARDFGYNIPAAFLNTCTYLLNGEEGYIKYEGEPEEFLGSLQKMVARKPIHGDRFFEPMMSRPRSYYEISDDKCRYGYLGIDLDVRYGVYCLGDGDNIYMEENGDVLTFIDTIESVVEISDIAEIFRCQKRLGTDGDCYWRYFHVYALDGSVGCLALSVDKLYFED